MINMKAPKDMTVSEFIDLVEKRYHTEEPTNMNAWINTLRLIASEPAPNPFTPDQLAWMREMQRGEINYAAMDYDKVIFFKEKPNRTNGYWATPRGRGFVSGSTFLSKFLSPDDPEPLCFADCAPLEGEPPCTQD